MLKTNLRRCLVFLLLLTACPLFAQTYNLGSNSKQIQFLTGKSRFHPGDDPQWASPSYDDSAWPLLNFNQPWTIQGYPKLTGYAWYRFTVNLPAGSPPASIMLPPIFSGYRLYENGRLIGSSGAYHPTFKVVSIRPDVFPLITSGSKAPQTIHIAIRVWDAPGWAHFESGGPEPGAWGVIGSDPFPDWFLFSNHLYRLNNGAGDFLEIFVDAILGLIVLMLYFMRRDGREYLWFAILQFTNGAAHIIRLMHLPGGHLSLPVYGLILADIDAVAWVTGLYFFSAILTARRGLWFRIALILAAVRPVAINLSWPGWLSLPVAYAIYNLCIFPATLWVIVLVVRRSYRRNPDALFLLVPTLVAFGYYLIRNIAETLAQFLPVTQFRWAYGIPIPVYPFHLTLTTLLHLVFGVAVVLFLVRRFVRAQSKGETLRHSPIPIQN